MTYTAVISVPAGDASTAVFHVSVVEGQHEPELALGQRVALPAVPLPVRASDPDRYAKVGKAAERELRDRGWQVRDAWWVSGDALYAEAAPAPGDRSH